MKRILLRWLLASICLLTAVSAYAAYPDRPITIIVPYAPGGSADALARLLAVRLAERLKANVIVDNRPGASGTIGAAYVAKAAPDGYTVLYDATPYSINPHLFASLPYAPTELQPLSLVLLAPNALIVKADSPYKSVADLVAKAKAQPGKINFASGGSGTVQRLASELFRQKLGLDMVHVPYKSGGPAITDVMGGQVDFMFSTIAASSPLVGAGKLRALAISSPKRAPQLPGAMAWAELLSGAEPARFEYEYVAHDHPLWVLFSSGTTGLPKAVVHSHVGILVEHCKLTAFHVGLTPESRPFYFSTSGWMMWNVLLGSLLQGATPVLYDGCPIGPDPEVLWKLVEQARVTHFGTSPSFAQIMQKAGLRPRQRYDLSALQMILLAGSPAMPETFAWVCTTIVGLPATSVCESPTARSNVASSAPISDSL